MFSNGLLIFLFLVISTPISWSQDATTAATLAEVEDIFLLCKREKSVRWLRAYKLDSGKCKTIYSKEGYLQVVSSATYFASCEGVLQSVQKNIEEGGFKCSPVQNVSVLDLSN